jgi:hypothetical protein
MASGIRDTTYQVTGLPFDQDHLFRIRAEAEKVLSEPTYPISFNRFRCKSQLAEIFIEETQGRVLQSLMSVFLRFT